MSKKYILDCENMQDRESAHAYIAEALNFPEYYGKNLDALFDCLTDMKKCSIVFKNMDKLEELGDYKNLLLTVFQEAAESSEKIKIIIDED